MKWLFGFLAFVFVSIFVSAFTMSVFLNTAVNSTDVAKASFREKTELLINHSLEQSFSAMDAQQQQQFKLLNEIPVAQRTFLLGEQCKQQQLKDQAFCDPEYLSGKLTLVNAFKKQALTQIEKAQDEAINQLKEKIESYLEYPLMLIAIVSLVLGYFFYMLLDGIFGGLQTIAGNIAWLSFLSALSFKFMKNTINNLLSVTQPPGADQFMLDLTKQVVFDWLAPAIQSAFWASIWLAIIAGIIWGVLKLFRNYDVGFERN